MSQKDDSKNIEECMICTVETKVKNSVKCPFCEQSACVSCYQTFLLGIDDDKPRCMYNDCKKVWSSSFLAENFPRSFYNKTYRERRSQIQLEQALARMPATQNLALQEMQRRENEKKIKDIMDESAMFRELIRLNDEKIRKLRYGSNNKEEEKEKIFTRPCPVEDCRGFLSKALKCGVCSVYSCKDCHLVKEEDHKCDPNLVATVKLLSGDTKPCPSCTAPIHKIEGCDQMYCVICHTAFSWKKGTIERGVIHNPHYYEFQRRQNGGIAPRVPGDMRCGGPPDYWAVSNVLNREHINFKNVRHAHRLINHINHVELPRHPNNVGENDNSDLCVEYLLKDIDRDKLKSKLKQRKKKQEKDSEFNMILSMFTSTMSDLFGNIVANPNLSETYIASMHELKDYTNKSLEKVGYQYGNVYPYIDDNWLYWTNYNSWVTWNKNNTRKLYS
jgi:hypothetical protein